METAIDRFKVIEVLTQTRTLLSKPGVWCQGTAARDINGNPVDSRSDMAIRFCMIGSFKKYALIYKEEDQVHLALCLTLELRSPAQTSQARPLSEWNDYSSRRKSQVLSLYDATIERLSEGSDDRD